MLDHDVTDPEGLCWIAFDMDGTDIVLESDPEEMMVNVRTYDFHPLISFTWETALEAVPPYLNYKLNHLPRHLAVAL